MRKIIGLAVFVVSTAYASAAFAQTTPPTLPDGPVESPPGWSCTASGGVVRCVKLVSQEPTG